MSEWKPIKTAPKDGTEILVWAHDMLCAIVHWNGKAWDDEATAAYLVTDVSHWMPLPSPPAGGATAVRVHTTASDPDGDAHSSDCARHNMPAMPAGECDCDAIEPIISQATGG